MKPSPWTPIGLILVWLVAMGGLYALGRWHVVSAVECPCRCEAGLP